MKDTQLPRRARQRPDFREASRPTATQVGVRGAGSRDGEAPSRHSRGPTGRANWLYGRHTVIAALANSERQWHSLAVLAGQEDEAAELVASARATWRGNKEPVRVLSRGGFSEILPDGAIHQGLALEVEPLAEPNLEEMLRHATVGEGRAIMVVLDRLTDPQNIGSILRSAAAFGALGVILAAHGAPPVTGALAKAASGAIETVPLVRVVNLVRALDRLKEAHFWICGLDEEAVPALAELDLGERVAIVLGAEGGGMRRLVRENCDYVARLPTQPTQPTLNVSNAAAVALYELVGRRTVA
jgi:23S rRNA (guanosine2251-2'-O)-methyltransferase